VRTWGVGHLKEATYLAARKMGEKVLERKREGFFSGEKKKKNFPIMTE